MQIHPCPECRALTQKWGSQTRAPPSVTAPLPTRNKYPSDNWCSDYHSSAILRMDWTQCEGEKEEKKRKKLPPVSFCEIYNFLVVVRKWTNGYQCNEGIFLIGLPGFLYWYSLQRIPQEMNFFLWRTALFSFFLPSSCIFSIRPGFKICPSISVFP